MILDFKADRWKAMRHRVICARTGEPIDLPIWYADDVEGVVRHYVRDEAGNYRLNAARDGGSWVETRKAVKVVPKAPEEIAAVDEMERKSREDVAAVMRLAQAMDDLRYGEDAT